MNNVINYDTVNNNHLTNSKQAKNLHNYIINVANVKTFKQSHILYDNDSDSCKFNIQYYNTKNSDVIGNVIPVTVNNIGNYSNFDPSNPNISDFPPQVKEYLLNAPQGYRPDNSGGNDITQLVTLPSGYHLNNNQNTFYTFTPNPQTVNLNVTGNNISSKVNVILNKTSSDDSLNSSSTTSVAG